MNLITGISPESYKAELRRQHHRTQAASRMRGMDAYHAAWERAQRFWAIYEQVNRDWCPDDPVYSATRSGMTPAATTDIMTFSAVASRQYRFLEIIIGSEGTASAAARAGLCASSGGTSGASGLTPEKFNTNSPVSMFTSSNLFSAWTGQPTHPAASRAFALLWGWNALGGFVDWKAAPGEEVYVTNEQWSFENVAGTAVISVTAVWEEL